MNPGLNLIEFKPNIATDEQVAKIAALEAKILKLAYQVNRPYSAVISALVVPTLFYLLIVHENGPFHDLYDRLSDFVLEDVALNSKLTNAIKEDEQIMHGLVDLLKRHDALIDGVAKIGKNPQSSFIGITCGDLETAKCAQLVADKIDSVIAKAIKDPQMSKSEIALLLKNINRWKLDLVKNLHQTGRDLYGVNYDKKGLPIETMVDGKTFKQIYDEVERAFVKYRKEINTAVQTIQISIGMGANYETKKRLKVIGIVINTVVAMIAQYGVIDPVLNFLRHKIIPKSIRFFQNVARMGVNNLYRIRSALFPRYLPKPLLSNKLMQNQVLDYDVADDLIKRYETLEKALTPKARRNTKAFKTGSIIVFPIALLFLVLSSDLSPQFIILAISFMISSLGQSYYMYSEEEILEKKLKDKKAILEKMLDTYKPQISSIQSGHLAACKLVVRFSSEGKDPWISANQMAKLFTQCLIFHNVKGFFHYGNKVTLPADFSIENKMLASFKGHFEASVARTREIILFKNGIINILRIVYPRNVELYKVPLVESNGLPSMRLEFNFPCWLESFLPKLQNLFKDNLIKVVTVGNIMHLSMTGWYCPSENQLQEFRKGLIKACEAARAEQKTTATADESVAADEKGSSYNAMTHRLVGKNKRNTKQESKTATPKNEEQKASTISWVVKGRVVTFNPNDPKCSVQPIRRTEGQHTFQSFIEAKHFITSEIPADNVPERLSRAIDQNVEAPKFVGPNQPGWTFWVSSQKDSVGNPFISSLKLTFRGRDRGGVRVYTYATTNPNGLVLHTATLAKPTAHKDDERGLVLLPRSKLRGLRP